MDTNILQQFLDVGLFDIGDDDERLKIFHGAADDFAKGIGKEPQKAVSATLVAIDPTTPDDDPVLDEAEAAVRGRWKAFRNKYSERPKGLLRPVVLEGLEKASVESPRISAVIWLVGINLLPHLQPQKERELIKELLLAKGALTEADAEKAWAPLDVDADLTLPELAFKLPEKAEGKTDRAALQNGLSGAAGPHDQNSKTGEIGR